MNPYVNTAACTCLMASVLPCILWSWSSTSLACWTSYEVQWPVFRWEPSSYGYHGDDGRKYCYPGNHARSNNKGTEYGPTFGTGDTVGAGLNLESQEIFFT